MIHWTGKKETQASGAEYHRQLHDLGLAIFDGFAAAKPEEMDLDSFALKMLGMRRPKSVHRSSALPKHLLILSTVLELSPEQKHIRKDALRALDCILSEHLPASAEICGHAEKHLLLAKKPPGSAGLWKFSLAVKTKEPVEVTMARLPRYRFIVDESLQEIGDFEKRYGFSSLQEARAR